MNKETKAKIEKNRKETSLKTMYFNRFLLVRYMSALFFFTNLYWFFTLTMSRSLLLLIPLMLMLLMIVSVAEQVRMYSRHSNHAKYTFYSFSTLFIVNVALIIMVLFTPLFQHLYPFLIDQSATRIFIIGALVAGLIISGFVMFRLNNIRQDKDWHFKRLQRYERALN
ncbi:hypothetical protein [Mammaliicoccus sp. Dog046]|uniref:hypothetical protein n=1 Tax=Mammaliicoccus sp. Dog046 TaxID=3034233 RepID=UPI002B25FE8F|nr:hypothetical protein [Mammaliicoccus sp. Dog046]WQK85114.1 hypothetical protein P3U32_10845 [Mammaliicoccus sp. Dog046]